MLFKYDTSDIHWEASVLNLEVKDQMISFRTPTFPYSIDTCITVNIILRQRRRVLDPLTFDYIPIGNKNQFIILYLSLIFSTMSSMSNTCSTEYKFNNTNKSK